MSELRDVATKTPGAELTTREALGWLGIAFMLGSVFGAFVTLLVR